MEEKLESIARYLFGLFHVTLVGRIRLKYNSTPDCYKIYEETLFEYSQQILDNNSHAINEFQRMHDLHTSRVVNDVSSSSKFITDIANHYTFRKLLDKVSADKKIKLVKKIIASAVIEYIQYLKAKDIYLYFERTIEDRDDIKNELKNHLLSLIKTQGAIHQYQMYNPTGLTVPKSLFDKVIKLAESQGARLIS